MAGPKLFCILAVLIAAPTALPAQNSLPHARPSPSLLFAARAQGPLRAGLAEADTLRRLSIGTYAKEGAIAGGLAGAVAGGLLAELACGLSEDANKSCTGGFLLGGVIGAAFGALPGALIGGLFPKYPKGTKAIGRPSADSGEAAD